MTNGDSSRARQGWTSFTASKRRAVVTTAAVATIEMMEARCLLSDTWLGGTGDWSDAPKWSTHQVPLNGDAVIINVPGSVVNLTDNRYVTEISTSVGTTINIQLGSQLQAEQGTIAGTLNINSGGRILGGSDPVILAGTSNIMGGISSGYVTNTGSMIVDCGAFSTNLVNNGTMTVQNTANPATYGAFMNRGVIINNGTLTLNAGIAMNFGSSFTNNASGTVTIANDLGFTYIPDGGGGAAPAIINNGTFTKTSSGTFAFSIYANLQNLSGAINVLAGTMSVQSSSIFQNTTFHVAPGAAMSFDSISPTDNTDRFSFSGTITATGGGHVLFNGGFVQPRLPDGTASSNTVVNFPIGYAQVTNTAFSNAGGVEIVNAGYLQYVGANDHPELELDNQGTITVTGTGNLGFGDQTNFVNDTTGVIDLQTDAGLIFVNDGLGGDLTFTNKGLIRKSGGTGTSAIGLINFGTVGGSLDIRSGVISLQDTGGYHAYVVGLITAAPGTSFNIDMGNAVLFVSGVLNVTGGGILNFNSGTLAGASNYSVGEDESIPGVLNFAPNTFFVKGGTFSDSTRIINTGTVVYTGPNNTGGLDNKGMALFADAGPFTGSLNFMNEPSGVMNFVTDSTLTLGYHGHLTNRGRLLKSGGAGTLDLSAVPTEPSGIFESASGTIALAGIGDLVAGETLQADAGASITTPSSTISTNDGAIILNGPGASIPALSGLTTNNGALSVLAGAAFATTGNLTNTGTLSIGGAFTVNGNFTQSLAPGSSVQPTLDFSVTGAPGSAGAPVLAVTGSTTLAGNLTAEFAQGFGAATGAGYNVANFSTAATGSFASTAGVAPDFTATVSPAHIVLNSTGHGLADLAVTSVTAPASFVAGQSATVTWTVTNTAPAVASSWDDSVYLSTDGTLNASSILLGRVTHTGGLEMGATYTGTLTAPSPAVVGAFKIIVVTDSKLAISDLNRANNINVSGTTGPNIPTLAVGTTTNGTITDQQDLLYKLTLTAGQDILFNSTFAGADQAEVYIKFAAIPTAIDFDESAADVFQTSRNTVISVTKTGDYYVLVHGREGAATLQAFSLTPNIAPFGPTSLTVSAAGNVGRATTQINGSGFNAATTIALVSGSTIVNAATVQFVDSNTLFATFDLTAQPAGLYGLQATKGANVSTLASAFTIQTGVNSALTFKLILPPVSRSNRDTKAVLQYTNHSSNDVPAPYFYIAGDNELFRLPDQTDYSDGSIEVLGISSTGPAGTLAAGATESITFFYKQKVIIGDSNGGISVSRIDPSILIDLTALKDDLRPANEPTDAWDAIYGNFLATIGGSLGGLNGVLRQSASALSAQGIYTADISALLDYALKQAGDFGEITRRYTSGAFGRGQSDPYANAVSSDASGNVTILSGGQERVFIKQTDGTYQGLGGDTAALTLAAGVYTLREANGQLTVFNTDGTLNYYQDTNGNRLTAGYTTGKMSSLVSTDGDTYSFTYDANSRITQATDPVGRVTTYAYDSTDQLLTSITTPDGTTSFTYVTAGGAATQYAVASIAYPDGTHRFYTYDAQGRLVTESRDNGAEAVQYSYDAVSNATVTDALGNITRFIRNGSDAIALVQDGLGNVARIAYDQAGRPTSATTPGGFRSTTTYDANGNPITETDAAGHTTNYSYDPSLDRLLTVTDPSGNTTHFTYDANGNLTGQTNAAGASSTFAPNSTGDVIQETSAGGRTATITYTPSHLVASQTFSDGTSATFTYDAHRNILSATNEAGTVTYTYDTADRVTSVTYPNGMSLNYTYDTAGRLSKLTDQTGFTTNYIYDSLGRLSQLTDSAAAVVTTYTYDADGRLSRKDNANGSSAVYTYDAAGNVLSVINSATGGAISSSFVYTYDANNRRASATTITGTTTYAYDALGQLTKTVLPGGRTITYAYDATGNRTTVSDSAAASISYSTNNLNEYVTVGDTTYTYDPDGNLTAKTNGSGTTTYTYNARFELIGMTSPGNTYVYHYDAQGHRIAVIHNGVTQAQLIDPVGQDELIGVFDNAGATVNHYTYGLGLTSELNAANSQSFYDFDASGNTADITSSAGAVSGSFSYLPFGEILNSTGTDRFTFGGQAGIQTTGDGFYFMRARNYSPTLGRFTQQDPIGLNGQDVNLYRYAKNDPVNLSDPSGLTIVMSEALSNSLDSLMEFAKPAVQFTYEQVTSRFTPAQVARLLKENTESVAFVKSLAKDVAEGLGENFYKLFPDGNITAAAFVEKGLEQHAANDVVLRAVLNDISVVSTVKSGLPITQIVIQSMTAVRDARSFNIEFPDGIPIQEQEIITGPAYKKAVKQPLADELIRNLVKQGITPTDQFIRDAIKLDADLVRARNQPSPTVTQPYETRYVNAFDPNDIFGVAGFGPSRFITGSQSLPYTITFENKPTASAPAQTVIVATVLDPNVNLSTFQLVSIGWGTEVITVPTGLQNYSTRVSYVQPDTGVTIFVDVSASLNLGNRTLTFTFNTLDSSTLDTPENPLVGFLPPDDSTGRGAGFVSYSVDPNPGLPTGAIISAIGSIVFDANAAIATPTWTNTIDAGAPTSTMPALAPSQTSTSFPLSWSGQDNAGGSGIASYTIYVSIDGTAFIPWLSGTTATVAVYKGSPGHSYAFYSVGTDNAGNAEIPAAAPVTTTIPPIARTLTVANGHPIKFTDAGGQLVTVTLSGPGTASLNFLTASGNADPISITFTGTTVKTNFIVKDSGGLTLSDISVDGSLASFNAAKANFTGDFTITGTLGMLALANLASGLSTIEILGGAVPTTFKFGTIADLSLTDAAAIKSFTAVSWSPGAFGIASLTAASLGKLQVKGIFNASLTIAGSALSISLGSLAGGTWSVGGNISSLTTGPIASTWSASITGNVGAFFVKGELDGSITAQSIKLLKVAGNISGSTITLTGSNAALGKLFALGSLLVTGSLTNSQLRAIGNIGSVTVGGANGSNIFAGVSNSVSTLPTASDIVGSSSILKFTTTGKSPFADTFIAASAIGTATITNATTSNAGIPFGLATRSLHAFTLHQPKQKPFTWTSKKPASLLATLPGDLRIDLL